MVTLPQSLRLLREIIFILWMGLVPTFLVLWYFPYIDMPIRALAWITGATFLAGALFFTRRVPVIPWLLAATYVALAVFILWPERGSIDRHQLQSNYCNALLAYVNCTYVWGGEGYLGIDCSGLVRKGMEDALARQGVSTLNPSLIRDSLSLYWHDTNAKTIGDGYGGRTHFVTECPTLNQLDYSLVQPGDLAVTTGGDHIMAYLGDKKWIAADPGAAKVTVFAIPEMKNAYFSTPMRIVRWKILDQ